MNKKDYINSVDKITAPESLIKKIEALDVPSKKKAPVWKTVVTIAACFVAVIFVFSGIMGTTLKAESDNVAMDMITDNGYRDESYNSFSDGTTEGSVIAQDASGSTTSKPNADRKIVQSANISIRTKEYDVFMAALKQKIEQYNGYIEASEEYNYSTNTNRNANMRVKVPADKLASFIEELSSIGTVASLSVTSDDITDSYISVESQIKALETEEKTLLSLLEKAESLDDVIKLQDRLSQVRSDLDTLKMQKQSYDGMVSYSGVTLDISEVERVVEGGDSFFGEVKEKLLNNLYDLGDFFREFAINIIAASPYIAIIGIIAAVVIIIIKKVKRKR